MKSPIAEDVLSQHSEKKLKAITNEISDSNFAADFMVNKNGKRSFSNNDETELAQQVHLQYAALAYASYRLRQPFFYPALSFSPSAFNRKGRM